MLDGSSPQVIPKAQVGYRCLGVREMFCRQRICRAKFEEWVSGPGGLTHTREIYQGLSATVGDGPRLDKHRSRPRRGLMVPRTHPRRKFENIPRAHGPGVKAHGNRRAPTVSPSHRHLIHLLVAGGSKSHVHVRAIRVPETMYRAPCSIPTVQWGKNHRA